MTLVTGLAQENITRMRDQLFFDGPERNRRLSRFWLLTVEFHVEDHPDPADLDVFEMAARTMRPR